MLGLSLWHSTTSRTNACLQSGTFLYTVKVARELILAVVGVSPSEALITSSLRAHLKEWPVKRLPQGYLHKNKVQQIKYDLQFNSYLVGVVLVGVVGALAAGVGCIPWANTKTLS